MSKLNYITDNGFDLIFNWLQWKISRILCFHLRQYVYRLKSWSLVVNTMHHVSACKNPCSIFRETKWPGQNESKSTLPPFQPIRPPFPVISNSPPLWSVVDWHGRVSMGILSVFLHHTRFNVQWILCVRISVRRPIRIKSGDLFTVPAWNYVLFYFCSQLHLDIR